MDSESKHNPWSRSIWRLIPQALEFKQRMVPIVSSDELQAHVKDPPFQTSVCEGALNTPHWALFSQDHFFEVMFCTWPKVKLILLTPPASLNLWTSHDTLSGRKGQKSFLPVLFPSPPAFFFLVHHFLRIGNVSVIRILPIIIHSFSCKNGMKVHNLAAQPKAHQIRFELFLRNNKIHHPR